MRVAGYRLVQPLVSSESHYAYLALCESGFTHRIYGLRNPAGASIERFERDRTRLRRAMLVKHASVFDGQILLDVPDHIQVAIRIEELKSIELITTQTVGSALGGQFAELASGLAEVHRMGAAHNCLSTQSIYLGRAPDPKIGLAGNLQVDLLEWILRSQDGDESWRASDAELISSDISSVGLLIDWLAGKLAISSDSLNQLTRIAQSCKSDDWTALPSMQEIAELLHNAVATPVVSAMQFEQTQVSELASQSAKHVSDANEATMPSEVPDLAQKSSQTETPLRSVGRFAIERRLGEGGMGAVYLGTDPSDGSKAAIKIIAQRFNRNDRAAKRFAKEARMLSTVRHPSIARLVEFNGQHDPMYLAMEYVEGGCLADFLKSRQPLPERLAVALIADAARGLSAAHNSGMVHRDIKPANLLLTERGRNSLVNLQLDESTSGPLVKLADFGLAKHHDSSESIALTQTGMILGTPIYMSPEQCGASNVDPGTDVYALGVTLFQCLSGRPPFEGESTVAVIRQHCDATIPNLRSLNNAVSDAVQQIVEKSLQKNPLMRHRDGGELLADLQRAINGEPSSMFIHPASIDTKVPGVLSFRYEWQLLSGPAALWPYISNTDRVNHAIGLPAVKYRTFVDPKLGVRRMATVKAMGVTMEWEEHPYEWVEGRRLSVLRQFPSGPFHWFVNVVELRPLSGGGTQVVQQLSMLPRNCIGGLLAKYEIGRKSGRNFGRVYRNVDQYLVEHSKAQSLDDPFAKSRALSSQKSRLLANRIERARMDAAAIDPTVFDLLEQFIQHASDLDVARMRPIALAERLGLSTQDVVQACLLLAREGVLVLLWDILCPTCRIPADVQETLKSLADHGHCEACNADFEIDFARSVELVFRVHPEIRPAETRTYCIGGPAFSSHVVVQSRLASQERLAIELDLADGQYRLRGPQLPFVVDLRVSSSGRTAHLELDLSRPTPRSAVPVLRSGTQVLLLCNHTTNDLQVRLERMASRADALTAADASRIPEFRKWFPGEVLSPGRMVSLTTVTLLACRIDCAGKLLDSLGDAVGSAKLLEFLQTLAQQATQCHGCVTKTMNDSLFAVFPSVVHAMEAAAQMLSWASSPQGVESVPLRLATVHGPAIIATINDRLDYFGRTAQDLVDLLERGASQTVTMSDSCLTEPGTIAALDLKWQLVTQENWHTARLRQ